MWFLRETDMNVKQKSQCRRANIFTVIAHGTFLYVCELPWEKNEGPSPVFSTFSTIKKNKFAFLVELAYMYIDIFPVFCSSEKTYINFLSALRKLAILKFYLQATT